MSRQFSFSITKKDSECDETNLLNLPVEAWYSWNKTAFLGVFFFFTEQIFNGGKKKNDKKAICESADKQKNMLRKYKKNVGVIELESNKGLLWWQ